MHGRHIRYQLIVCAVCDWDVQRRAGIIQLRVVCGGQVRGPRGTDRVRHVHRRPLHQCVGRERLHVLGVLLQHRPRQWFDLVCGVSACRCVYLPRPHAYASDSPVQARAVAIGGANASGVFQMRIEPDRVPQ